MKFRFSLLQLAAFRLLLLCFQTTWNNTEKIKHERSATVHHEKSSKIKRVQQEKSTIWKERNTKKVQHENGEQHEKSAI